jgi:hypothetical protein
MQDPGNFNREWHVHDLGQQYGPFAKAEIVSMMAEGRISPAAHVWREGMAGWVPIATVIAVAPAPPMMPGYPPIAPPSYAPYQGQQIGASNRIPAGIFGILLGCLEFTSSSWDIPRRA